MPKFFFDVEGDATPIRSEEANLPDPVTARAFAEGLAETLQGRRDDQPPTIIVRDENGRVVERVSKPGS